MIRFDSAVKTNSNERIDQVAETQSNCDELIR